MRPPTSPVQRFGIVVTVLGLILLVVLAVVQRGPWLFVAPLFVAVAAALLLIDRDRSR